MKKIISIIILMIIILVNLFTITSNAINITSADLYSKGYFVGLLKWGDIRLVCNYVVYQKDGVEYPAYCLQRDLPGVTEDNPYTVSVNSLVNNVSVWRTIINGYPYKTVSELGCQTEIEAFFATKQAVYCALYNRDLSEYSALSPEGERCLNALNQIVTAARTSNISKISADININSVNENWEIDAINNEFISKEFSATANATINEYTISLNETFPEGTKVVDIDNNEKTTFESSENFKILIPLKNIEQDGSFNINVSGQVKTKPIFYGKSSNSLAQDYALTASSYEDGTGTSKIYYTKNGTKLIILKKNETTNQSLEGVKFTLLDSDQKEIYTDLITNQEGKIIVDNLIPGTYYIKETKTLEGYTIYDKLIKVEPELNEELTVIVNNNESKVNIDSKTNKNTLTVSNKSSETVVKLPKTGM